MSARIGSLGPLPQNEIQTENNNSLLKIILKVAGAALLLLGYLECKVKRPQNGFPLICLGALLFFGGSSSTRPLPQLAFGSMRSRDDDDSAHSSSGVPFSTSVPSQKPYRNRVNNTHGSSGVGFSTSVSTHSRPIHLQSPAPSPQPAVSIGYDTPNAFSSSGNGFSGSVDSRAPVKPPRSHSPIGHDTSSEHSSFNDFSSSVPFTQPDEPIGQDSKNAFPSSGKGF
jgi:hypothetical protein